MYRKPIFFLIGVAFSSDLLSQTNQNVRQFSALMNYKRSFNTYTRTASYGIMESTLRRMSRPSNPSDVEAAIEGMGGSVTVSDSFLLQIVAYQSGGQEIARMMCYKLCDNMKLSIALVNYINTKYKAKITQARNARLAQVRAEQKAKEESEVATLVVDQSNNYFYSQNDLDRKPFFPKSSIDSLILDYCRKNAKPIIVESRLMVDELTFLIDTAGKVYSAFHSEEGKSLRFQVDTLIFKNLIFDVGRINGVAAPYKYEYYTDQELIETEIEINRDKDGNISRVFDNVNYKVPNTSYFGQALLKELRSKGSYTVKAIGMATRHPDGNFKNFLFIKVASFTEQKKQGYFQQMKSRLPILNMFP